MFAAAMTRNGIPVVGGFGKDRCEDIPSVLQDLVADPEADHNYEFMDDPEMVATMSQPLWIVPLMFICEVNGFGSARI